MYSRKIVFVIIFISSVFTAGAQIKFQRTYGIGLYNEGRCVRQTFDGGYIIAGSESDAGNGSSDVYLLKIDSLGIFQWNKTFGGSNIDRGYSVEQLNDSGYVVCGYTNSFGNGGYDGYLIRTDKNGDTLWTKTYGGTDWDFLYSMKKTLDGGFVMAGNSYSNLSGISESWVFKIDSTGSVQWSKEFLIPSESFLNSIIQTVDSDFIAVGYCTGGSNNSNDILAIKLSSSGDSLWSHLYGNTSDDIGTSIDNSMSGGYILGATIGNLGTGYGDFYLLKIDTSGTEEWHQEYTSSAGDFLYTIHELSNGNGYATSGMSFGAGGGGGDYLMIISDNVGSAVAGPTYGTPLYDVAYDMTQCSDKGFILVGKTNGLRPGLESILLVKTDSIGVTSSTQIISVQELGENKNNIICYPNPSNELIHVSLSGRFINEKTELSLINLAGQKMFSQQIDSEQLRKIFIVRVEDVAPGFYILSVLSNNFNYKKKLFISH